MSLVPVIDIGSFRRGNLPPEQMKQLDTACRDHGFFLLAGHDMDDQIAAMWSATQQFFDLPRSQKLELMRSETNPLGYYDRELTKQKRDLKEVFDFKAGGYQSSNNRIFSQWPADLPGFEQTLSEYFTSCTRLAEETLSLVYNALDIAPEQRPPEYGENHTSSMRLNHYPVSDPLSSTEQGGVNNLGDMALHHHTDPGTITLLLQDETGGLQALSKSHGWIDVAPLRNTFVVNLGDVMQVQTNDQYVAAVHRVKPMTGCNRYSTPFFYQPRFDSMIEPLPGLGKPLYQPFSWRDYIRGRVSDNYADLGEDDIQISRYRAEQ